MQDNVESISPPNSYLNRDAWHKPLISVIITHFNYVDHIENAILSVIDQTYDNWECVIVDDNSKADQWSTVNKIINRLNHSKIRLVSHNKNLGQTPAFFSGMDVTAGEFICLLDPDDRYAQDFLEQTLAAHMNKVVMCPIVATEQYLIRGDQLLSQVYTNKPYMEHVKTLNGIAIDNDLFFFPAQRRGWHWASTSSMMFRRDAANLLRPNKRFDRMVSADAYMAQGCHMLGGSLFLKRPLIYRGVHDQNAYLRNAVFSSLRYDTNYDGAADAARCCADAIEALKANGVDASKLWDISKKSEPRKKKTTLQRWRRSIEKRWPFK